MMQAEAVIPSCLHQIFINEATQQTYTFHAVIEENIRSIKACYPTVAYKLWTLNELDKLIAENFDKRVLKAFRLLKPYAYKADLAKLCLLYLFGGLYIDLGVRLIQPLIAPKNFGLIAFQDIRYPYNLWASMATAVIWVQTPKHKAIELAINKIVFNCERRYYGDNALCPTGPVVLGFGVVKAMNLQHDIRPHDFWIGELTSLAKHDDTVGFMTPLKQLFGIRVKSISHGDVSQSLNANRYSNMWRNKDIYHDGGRYFEATSLPLRPAALSSASGVTLNSTIADKGYNELTFGPYISLVEGLYKIQIEMAEGSKGAVAIRLSADCGETIIEDFSIQAAQLQALNFTLKQQVQQFEVQIKVDSYFMGYILGYTIMSQVE